MTRILAAFAAACILSTAACGGGGGNTPPVDTNPPTTSGPSGTPTVTPDATPTATGPTGTPQTDVCNCSTGQFCSNDACMQEVCSPTAELPPNVLPLVQGCPGSKVCNDRTGRCEDPPAPADDPHACDGVRSIFGYWVPERTNDVVEVAGAPDGAKCHVTLTCSVDTIPGLGNYFGTTLPLSRTTSDGDNTWTVFVDGGDMVIEWSGLDGVSRVRHTRP